jgi:hypothetical protein
MQDAAFVYGDLDAKRREKARFHQRSRPQVSAKPSHSERIEPSRAAPEDTTCFNCGNVGHYALKCPKPKRRRDQRDHEPERDNQCKIMYIR